MKRTLAVFYTLTLLVSVPAQFCSFAIASPQQLPVEAFASIPDVTNVTLSPDGKNIATVVRLDLDTQKGSLVNIYNVASGKSVYPVQTDNQKFTITNLFWASNDILLIYAKYPAVRYGIPTNEWRLFKYSISQNELSSVIKPMVLKRFQWKPQDQSDVIDMLYDDNDHILMQFTGLGNTPENETVMKINLGDGRSSVVQYAVKNVISWTTDKQHRVRVGIYLDDTHYRIIEQTDNNENYRTLWEFEAFSEEQVWPMGFGQNANILYIQAYHEGFKAIFTVDLTDPKLTKKLVFKRDNLDVTGGLIYSKVKQDYVGISDSEDAEYTFWDPEYSSILNGLNQALPDTRNYLTQYSEDERRYIVMSTSATDSGTYFLGDRDAKTLVPIAYRYKQLLPELMATTQTINYKARDGLSIEGFLTIPKDSSKNKLPAIVFPHGGPISYDNNSFDYWTQYFANRGYAVLRMNFRGSDGYGFDFMKAGIKNWGLEMQTDVEDGAHWLIEQGIADPAKICIAGASYGGYAALMAVATTKELFQCAISFAGVTDVEDLVKSHRRFRNFELVKQQIGDDYNALYARSPVSKAKDINVPVLLIHGEKDRVVDVEHSEDMFDALQKYNKNVKFVELEDGDHYLSDNADRLKTFYTIDAFLKKYLPVQ